MAEQKIEPCPYCGGNNMWPQRGIEMHKIVCHTCGYMSGERPTKTAAIAAHNALSRNNAAAKELLEEFKNLTAIIRGELPCKYSMALRRADAAIAKTTGGHDNAIAED